MKVLLTGANGQVGNEVRRKIPDTLQPFVNLISFDHAACDIATLSALEDIFALHQPDIVINAASYTQVDQAEKNIELAYSANATGVKNLAHCCKQLKIPLIHISTDYVFDGFKNTPYLEDDETNPLGVYGKSKREGEILLEKELAEHIILRTSWVFGAFGNNFVKTMLRLAETNFAIRVVADQFGCPTSAASIAETIWKFVEKFHLNHKREIMWGTYHYTNFAEVSWYEFAKSIITLAAQSKNLTVRQISPITTAEYPTLAKRPAYTVLDCQKIKNNFGIEQQSWEIELQKMLDELVTQAQASSIP